MYADLPKTLIEVLENQATSIPTKIAYTFEGKSISYGEMLESIKIFATNLSNEGVIIKQNVLIALPNGHDFINSFFGCQLIGAIPVPIPPYFNEEWIQSILDISNAKHIIDDQNKTIYSELNIHLHQPQNLSHHNKKIIGIDFPLISPENIAFIQFTSGSTGSSKGVPLTHRNLVTNINQMIIGMKITPDDIFVSWLPIYHDMGLILMLLTPLYLGVTTHLLQTSLAKMDEWLKEISTRRATFTAAPDFAYRMLNRFIKYPDKYNLDSLRVALNAAEPVRKSTIENFHNNFNLKNVMVAGYGLAEATVGVTMWTPSTTNKIDKEGTVSVGKPFPEISISIIENDELLKINTIGEIVVNSSANCEGYLPSSNNNHNLFWQNNFIKTGDLGYLDENGNLFIVGRKKHVIKVAGRTIAPRYLEECVDKFAEIRYSAALGIDFGDFAGEQIYIIAEMRKLNHSIKFTQNYQSLAMKIINSIYDHVNFRPAKVVLVKSKSIPKTHNGKIKYGELKKLYVENNLSSRIIFST